MRLAKSDILGAVVDLGGLAEGILRLLRAPTITVVEMVCVVTWIKLSNFVITVD